MAADLPIPSYDPLPLSQVQSRMRTLRIDQLEQLVDSERAHAGRVAVLTTAEARPAQLQSGAEPSDGSPTSIVPGAPGQPDASPPIPPQTAGPTQNPPSQGMPSNPAQPR